MFMQRYFAKEKINEEFILYETDIHHIKNVMRMNMGEIIEIVRDNKLYLGEIINLEDLVKVKLIKTYKETIGY